MLFLQISISIILIIISFQDFKHRAISWWLIPVLFLLALTFSLLSIPPRELLFNFLTNIGIILFELLLLTLYFSIKNRSLTNIINKYIGIGDVLFFIPLCMFFSPLNFILFKVISLLATLIAFVIYILISKQKNIKIPMAGTLSIAMILIIVSKNLFNFENFNDGFVLNAFMSIYE